MAIINSPSFFILFAIKLSIKSAFINLLLKCFDLGQGSGNKIKISSKKLFGNFSITSLASLLEILTFDILLDSSFEIRLTTPFICGSQPKNN